MSEEILIRQGAPTLAGIKTGSLFPCPCEDREALLGDIRQLNRRLSPKGLCLLPPRCASAGPAGRAGVRAAAAGGLRGRELRALCGAACLPLPREQRVSARGGAIPQLPAGGCEGLHRPPRERFQVRGALEGLRRRGKGALAVHKIQKMHGDLLCSLAKRLEARAACRRGLII